jgi:hypothetical protein|tara:strand:+ start:497 stop:925 length:429 start_codon:yes stop_codon:yes gene_type:complete
MSLKATVKVGSAISILVEGQSMVELIKAASSVSGLPQECGHCKGTRLSLHHREAGDSKQYSYLSIKCDDCGAAGDLGQNQAPNLGDVYFQRNPKDKTDVKDGFYKYWEQSGYKLRAKGNDPSLSRQVQQAPVKDEQDDDIPF